MDDWQLKPARDIGTSGLERCSAPYRESGLVESAARLVWWSFLRTSFRIWNRLQIVGRENLPSQPPYVLVANHSSHLDALLLTTLLPIKLRDCTFPLAARDVFFERLSLAKFSATFINSLPVPRGTASRHTLKALRERLESDRCVMILFPEGTRSRTGEPGSFKAGVGMLVAGAPVPVVPCYIDGAFAALPPKRHFVRPSNLRVHIGSPLSFADTKNSRSGWDYCAEHLEKSVFALGGRNLSPREATVEMRSDEPPNADGTQSTN